MDKKASNQSKLQDYEILNKLGQGSFGVVYKVKRKNDSKIYVLKQIDISRMSSGQKKEAVHEATILSKINSPYIVKFYDSFTDKNQINIIMEYCENGDLGIYLKRQMGKQLSESRIWKFFIEMCLGMQYLHANKILHRDIKTINMFLTKEDKIKIGDLGVAKMLNQTANFAHTVVGTPYYLSPELCEEKPYNHKSDIWSLGCVLYELCTLKHPFESNNQGALILKIVRGKYNPISTQYSKDLSSMVDSCLCKDYKKRPSINDILGFPIMVEKSSYFGYSATKPLELRAQPLQTPQQQKSAMPSEQVKKINDAAAALRQNQNKSGQNAPSNVNLINQKDIISQREKQYQQNLIDAKNKQQQQVQQYMPSNKDKEKDNKNSNDQQPKVLGQAQQKPVISSNNIPSSYVDPSKRQQPPIVSPQLQVNNNRQNGLNNNQFDQKEFEKKQVQQNQLQQKRPISNQNVRQQPIISQAKQQQDHQQIQPIVKQIVSTSNLNQQYAAQQQQQQAAQQKQNPQSQRVKTGAPQQLSRQAQMAQKVGQRIIKQGDNDRQPIFKPDIKALKGDNNSANDKPKPQPQQQHQPVTHSNSGSNQKSSGSGKQYSNEIQEVMNLPDEIDAKKKNGNQQHQMKTNQEIIQEAQRKRDALNRVNNKFNANDVSNKAASELHDMKLVMPQTANDTPKSNHSSYQQSSTEISKGYQSTEGKSQQNYYEEEEELIPVGQKQIDDDEFAELLNGGGQFVQANWNIRGTGLETGNLRETQFVPHYEESKDDDDDQVECFKVQYHRDVSPINNKMKTIKEEDEDRRSNGSDTAYFSHDPEAEFNDRDDHDDADEVYKQRMEQLEFNDYDDEDNQPYDLEEQQRREQEEFGDDEEEEDQEDQEDKVLEEVEPMSRTMQQEQRKIYEREIKKFRIKQNEYKLKIERKVQEGSELAGVQFFKECFALFCQKAQDADDMTDKDMIQINQLISSKIQDDKAIQLTGVLFQLYFYKEELANSDREIQSLSQKIHELD